MNELARRFRRQNAHGFPYGTTEDNSAFEEFARVMKGNADNMARSFGGHQNFLAYLNGVQPSRNIEIAPWDPYYNPNNDADAGFTDEEQAQYEREYDDQQDANPLRKPDIDGDSDFRTWIAALFANRGRK